MRVTIAGATTAAFLVALGCDTPTRPGQMPVPRDLQVFEDQQAGFDATVRDLGTRISIDFEDIDASPVSDTISGRPPFDRLRYSNRGMLFSNPRNYPLYIAPGGLFWNPTNSLSVGRFPFGPADDGPVDADDDLTVTLEPGCLAAAFSVIDKAETGFEDFVEFFDHEGRRLRRLSFPRTFLGMVAPVTPSLVQYRISRIVISEGADDGDDVTYDNFICIQ